MEYDLTHARHNPAHCLAPGLFRALKRGERRHSKLDVVYDYGGDIRIEFSGPEPLGAEDLRVLQGLVAMGGPSGLVLGPELKSAHGRQLRLFLEPRWDALETDALVVKGSYRSLAREIGYSADSGQHLRLIRGSIERLWKVSIIVQRSSVRQGFRLLSEYRGDEVDKRLYVALNPLITQTIIGNGQHVRISMDEVRKLRSETARLLHQRLCAWVNPGKRRRVALDTLCSYVWPDSAGAAARRKRHQRVKQSIKELVDLGWSFSEYSL